MQKSWNEEEKEKIAVTEISKKCLLFGTISPQNLQTNKYRSDTK